MAERKPLHPIPKFVSDPRVLLAAIVLGGLVPRLYRLSARSLWFDEAFAWRVLAFPFTEMIQRIGRDNGPPLYYILLRGWATLFGESAFALRSLSVLFGSLAILGVYLFSVEAFGTDLRTGKSNDVLRARGRGIGLLAATLTALSGLQIRYSWEARMYALAVALAIFSSWALFRALRPPSRWRRWLLYGSLALLLAYTHYYGLFTLAAQAIFVALFLLSRAEWNLSRLVRDPAFRHALFAAAFAVACWLPWLPVFLHQRAQVEAAFWSRPVTRWDVTELCYQMFVMPEAFSPPPRQRQLFVADLCLLGLWLLRRKAKAADWYVLLSAVTPLLLALAFSVPFTLRYFIVMQLFLLLGLAALIWRLPGRLERTLAVAAALLTFLGTYGDFWTALDVVHKPGARGAADFLRQQRRTEEPVIVCLPLFYFPLLHYTPDRAGYYLYSDGHPMPHYYGTAALTTEDLITDEQMRTLRSRRVWVVDMAGGQWGARWVPALPNWTVKSRHAFPDVVRLGEVIVVEYEIATGQKPNMHESTAVGRLAPSPTGAQHVGNARTYLIAWLSVRRRGGRIVLRIEDIDSPRVKAGAEQQAREDLHWLGIDWDEGPIVQSERLPLYRDALAVLQARESVYPCTCTRGDVERAASAPHREHEGPSYPGTCSGRRVRDAEALGEQPYCWRFRVPAESPGFLDGFLGPTHLDLRTTGGDFVVWKAARAEGVASTPAYQLAVVVDDAAQGVNEVIRGDDLIPSTPRQLLLYDALGLTPPSFAHVPLVVGPDGRRLAKRHGDTRLASLRAAGVRPEMLLGMLAWSCGWLPAIEPISARALLPLFRLETIPRQPFVLTPELLRRIGYAA